MNAERAIAFTLEKLKKSEARICLLVSPVPSSRPAVATLISSCVFPGGRTGLSPATIQFARLPVSNLVLRDLLPLPPRPCFGLWVAVEDASHLGHRS